MGVFHLLPWFQPALIQLSYFCLLCVAPRRLNQGTFQLKLRTFPFKTTSNTRFASFFFSLTQALESARAPALFHSLVIYKGTSPVCIAVNGKSPRLDGSLVAMLKIFEKLFIANFYLSISYQEHQECMIPNSFCQASSSIIWQLGLGLFN